MVDEPAIVDPVQAGCAMGRSARREDAAAGLEPPSRAVLLMRGAIVCAALLDLLPGPPLHDPAIARERFVWAFVLGYMEGAKSSTDPVAGASSIGQPARGRPPTVRRGRRTVLPRIAASVAVQRRVGTARPRRRVPLPPRWRGGSAPRRGPARRCPAHR